MLSIWLINIRPQNCCTCAKHRTQYISFNFKLIVPKKCLLRVVLVKLPICITNNINGVSFTALTLDQYGWLHTLGMTRFAVSSTRNKKDESKHLEIGIVFWEIQAELTPLEAWIGYGSDLYNRLRIWHAQSWNDILDLFCQSFPVALHFTFRNWKD